MVLNCFAPLLFATFATYIQIQVFKVSRTSIQFYQNFIPSRTIVVQTISLSVVVALNMNLSLPFHCGLPTCPRIQRIIDRRIINLTRFFSSAEKLQADNDTIVRERARKASARKQAKSKDTSREAIHTPLAAPNDPSFSSGNLNAYVTCHPGLEPFLSQELNLLGIGHSVEPMRHRVRLNSPSASDLFRCHLFLGTASQILVSCGEDFGARGWPELQRKVERIPWREILQNNVQLMTKVSATKSKLYHRTAIQERIDASIYKVLGRDVQTKDSVNASTSGNSVALQAIVQHDRVQFYLSSSVDALHRRRYRLETGKAPLREDLAYAFLWNAGLRPVYYETPNAWKYDAVLDPFCGAGTVAIEAAGMLTGLPPGRLLPEPFLGSTLHNPKVWSNLVSAATRKARVDKVLVSASDRDAGSYRATISNTNRAGLIDVLQVSQCAFSSHPWLENPLEAPQKLLIASNLPFGRRTTVRTNKARVPPLLPMFQKLSGLLNKLSENGCSHSATLLTDDPTTLMRSGLRGKSSSQFKIKHGGIPVFAWTTEDQTC